ncbi:MAG: tetratricopeptide repeat protein [Terracidiphilus sp.]
MWGRLLFLAASLAVPLFAAPTGQAPGGTSPQSAEDHLNLAKRYLTEKKTDMAISELKQVVALDPANVEAQGNLGVLLYFRGDYASAVPNLRAALKAQPDLWKIQALLGMAENLAGDRQASRDDLETAFPHLADQKVQLDAGGVLIDLYSNGGDLDKAASIVAALLTLRPTDASLLYLSYRIHSDLANRAILTIAIADPASAELYQAMARELAKQGQTDQAVADYREAIRINPRLPGAHTELGDLFYHSQDVKLQAAAAGEFQTALDVNPRDEKAELAMGILAARRGDVNSAYTDDSRALQLEPSDSDACTELAKVLIQMDRKDEARRLLERAVQIDPSNYVAHFRLGTLYRQQGKADEAKQQVELYLRYKQMHEKLEKIIHDLRVASAQDAADHETDSPQ